MQYKLDKFNIKSEHFGKISFTLIDVIMDSYIIVVTKTLLEMSLFPIKLV